MWGDLQREFESPFLRQEKIRPSGRIFSCMEARLELWRFALKNKAASITFIKQKGFILVPSFYLQPLLSYRRPTPFFSILLMLY